MPREKHNFNKEFLKLNAIGLPFKKTLFPIENVLLNLTYKFAKASDKISITKETILGYKDGEINIDIFEPKNTGEKLPCLVYFHGGAFVFQKASVHKALLSFYAKNTPCKIVVVDYRLAPKFPFPYGVEDCYAAFKWTHDNAERLNIDHKKIAIGGDSAGGCLAASVTLMNRSRENLDICLQMLIYPCLDYELKTESMKKYSDTPVFDSRKARFMWSYYLLNGNLGQPAFASPSHAESHKDLPNAYIETAEFDCLRDEGIQYAKKLEAAGVGVKLVNTIGTVHCFDALIKNKIVQESLEKRILALQRAFGLQ